MTSVLDIAVDTPIDAYFIEAPSGPLFGVYIPAIGSEQRQVLCVPPFTEESNRSRVMLGRAARALAQQGTSTLILDLFGTGNSAGEFREARWATWQDDVLAGIEWLRAKSTQGEPPVLWGTRLSALLVASVIAERQSVCSRLLFWQPVVNGKLMFTQYLRLRVATSLDTYGRQENTNELRERLAAGETLDVGGYEIAPGLATDLDALTMPVAFPDSTVRVDWLERVEGEKRTFMLPSTQLIKKWSESGVQVAEYPFTGPPFWQLHERFLADELVAETVRALQHD